MKRCAEWVFYIILDGKEISSFIFWHIRTTFERATREEGLVCSIQCAGINGTPKRLMYIMSGFEFKVFFVFTNTSTVYL